MSWSSETWERLAALPLTIDAVELSFPRLPLARFERVTTVISLTGLGEEGLGEDVNYDASEHEDVRGHGPAFDAVGTWTLGSFCELVDRTELFPTGGPEHAASLDYRRWAWQSAALDLALRQADTDLATAFDRTPRAVHFVSSAGVGSPPSVANLQPYLDAVPDLRFKLDAGSDWDDAFLAELTALDRADCVDFKAFYTGTIVDTNIPTEQAVRIAAAVPEATLEDVAPGETTTELAKTDARRLSWDAPIHTVADLEALPITPQRMNVKPSRIGSIRELLDVYEWLESRDVEMYGGGQFELSIGRGQIILLASLMHPGGANDTAPVAFHGFQPGGELPSSPLPAPDALRGFRWPSDER